MSVGTFRLVVLVSGSGTNPAGAARRRAPIPSYGAHRRRGRRDKPDVGGWPGPRPRASRRSSSRSPTTPTGPQWDEALAKAIGAYEPDLVVLAGFMRVARSAGPRALSRPAGQHPSRAAAVVPGRPRGSRRARVRGEGHRRHGAPRRRRRRHRADHRAGDRRRCSTDDDEATLHERIKVEERALLVDTVGRLGRGGYRIEGRKVTPAVSRTAVARHPPGAGQRVRQDRARGARQGARRRRGRDRLDRLDRRPARRGRSAGHPGRGR